MELLNIKSAQGLAESLYGIVVNSADIEDILINAWELIGNKHTRLYRYVGDTINKELELPCNADVIESVHISIPDAQVVDPRINFYDQMAIYTEGYIDSWKKIGNPHWNPGKLLPYKEGDGVLYFSKDYTGVTVIYHGIIVDDEGLPLITAKESRAIAAYLAYITLLKNGLTSKDSTSMSLAGVMKETWLKTCSSARIPDHVSQNDMNDILDVKTRWDRKHYGLSYKPMV